MLIKREGGSILLVTVLKKEGGGGSILLVMQIERDGEGRRGGRRELGDV